MFLGLGLLSYAAPAAELPLLLAQSRLAELSLEELGSIRITSASKRPEPLSDAPAAVFVIKAEDIRRSGATRLPEALRLAPNLQVARSSGIDHAISARGFNGLSANKLLVLIDGRSVYTPLFSGVFWDVQDVPLEDVERIEVISGPAGTLWGVNAVNGVINVVTRATAATAGTLVAGGTGNRESGLTLRYGFALGRETGVRIYARHSELDATRRADDTPMDDGGHHTQLGFRADWQGGDDSLTLQGDAYDATHGQPEPGRVVIAGVALDLEDVKASGAHLLGRWQRRLGGEAELMVQAYLDHSERRLPPTFVQRMDIADLQLQHTLPALGRHRPVWGVQLRRSRDRVDNRTAFFAFLPERAHQTWTSVFAQDTIGLREDLQLTVGTRVERNDYTGTDFLPSARLAWKLAPDHMLWTAWSRAVRAPSRLDRDAYLPADPPHLLGGGPDFDAEVAKVAELGYRGRPAESLLLSATVFHTRYDDLRALTMSNGGLPLVYDNGMKGTTRGLELWATWQPLPDWRLNAGYTYLRQSFGLKGDAAGTDPFGEIAALEDANPGHSWQLRSSHDLGRSVELDWALRRVSSLPGLQVDSYLAFDLRVGWRPRQDLDLSLTGTDLFDRHEEFANFGGAPRSEYGRAVFAKLLLRF